MQEFREDLEEFKATLSITRVAEALGLSVHNGKFACIYPMRHAHGDRTPSVSISESKGMFRCWVCPDVRGDVIELVKLVKECSFNEALSWLKENFRPWENSQSLAASQKSKTIEKKIESNKNADSLSEKIRMQVVLSFLKKLDFVDNTPAASWLIKRRIFKPVWDKMRLRYVKNYEEVSKSLLNEFGKELLQKVGLFNEKGNLRYYKHRLIFPYLDSQFRSLFFQARTIEKDTKPKEQNLAGYVPYPYNVSALDGHSGWIYLCEGVIDTLTVLGRGLQAVGIPGVNSFKAAWCSYFKEKSVILCLDQDEAGRRGTTMIKELLQGAGIHVTENDKSEFPKLFRLKDGEDINDLFGGSS